MAVHPAVTYKGFRVGKYAREDFHPVVKLGLIGATGKSWHILDPNSPICNSRGHVVTSLEEVNAHTIKIEGRAVCGRCRRALGNVPLGKGA